MTELFPLIQPELEGWSEEGELPLAREAAWDFERGIPLWKNGNPVMASGAEAVLVWAWKALMTQRRRCEIYSWNYGNECGDLVGQPYTAALKNAEAVRFVQECLMVNPYITGVKDVLTNFDKGTLHVDCTLETIYGEVKLRV